MFVEEQLKTIPVSIGWMSPLLFAALSCLSVMIRWLMAPSSKPLGVNTSSSTSQATLKSPPVFGMPTRWSCPFSRPLLGYQGAATDGTWSQVVGVQLSGSVIVELVG